MNTTAVNELKATTETVSLAELKTYAPHVRPEGMKWKVWTLVQIADKATEDLKLADYLNLDWEILDITVNLIWAPDPGVIQPIRIVTLRKLVEDRSKPAPVRTAADKVASPPVSIASTEPSAETMAEQIDAQTAADEARLEQAAAEALGEEPVVAPQFRIGDQVRTENGEIVTIHKVGKNGRVDITGRGTYRDSTGLTPVTPAISEQALQDMDDAITEFGQKAMTDPEAVFAALETRVGPDDEFTAASVDIPRKRLLVLVKARLLKEIIPNSHNGTNKENGEIRYAFTDAGKQKRTVQF